MQPIDIRQVGEKEILILWQDGHRSLYSVYFLRCACQCSDCVDEATGRKKLITDQIPKGIKPLKMIAVGRYAIRFEWSDGHSSGIYPFEYLRELCPCKKCKAHCSFQQ